MRYSIYMILLIVLIGCKKEKPNVIQQIIVNDTLIAKGQMDDTLKIGYWKYYDQENRLVAISDYKIVNDKSYLNQEIVFDKSGDTIFEKSSYFSFSFGHDNSVQLKFKKILDQESYAFFIYSDKINSDFSNIDVVKLDTIFFKEDQITFNLQSNYLRGLIKEVQFTSDTSFIHRNVYVDINKKSKDISTVSKQ